MMFYVLGENRVNRSGYVVSASSSEEARTLVLERMGPGFLVISVVEHPSNVFLVDIEPLKG